jgi:hypothetical protein
MKEMLYEREISASLSKHRMTDHLISNITLTESIINILNNLFC